MKNDTPIITSLLDQDKYKFTMLYVFFTHFSSVLSRYKFKNRSDINLIPFKDEIIEQLKAVCELRLTDEELKFIKKRNPYFNDAYIEFLRNMKLNFDYLDIREENGELYIGTHPNTPLIYTTWFEIFILSIVQEIYTRKTYPNVNYDEGKRLLQLKIDKANHHFKNVSNFIIAEFGCRRRFNRYWHEYVLEELAEQLPKNCFVGTSNMYFAKQFDILDIGTMAHEYLCLGQQIQDTQLVNFQKYMLQKWTNVYRGELGIALSDTVGFDAFLRDFDKYFAKLYDGVRHDSGSPFELGDRMIEHYKSLKINPNTKTVVFSDGVNFDLMIKLVDYFRGRINVSFGIGTNLVNDLGPEYKALQLVMKLVEVNGKPVAKISDSPGKGMCEDDKFLSYLKKVFQIKEY